MSSRLALLESPKLTIAVRIALGLIFVGASLPKIVDPPGFAHMIYNYRLVPGSLVNFVALVLPWLELLCGIALTLGIWKRTAAGILGFLLVLFIVGLGVNLARMHPIDCGCFDMSATGLTPPEQMLDMLWVMVRDLAMVAMALQVFIGTWHETETSATGQ